MTLFGWNDSGSPKAAKTAALSGAGAARSVGLWLLILLLVYAAGLTREISAPWAGMHDWNGAFFSQLARNFLRYPLSVDHGMPMVAMGSAVPPVGERSIYATHPPGLVWLVAGAFEALGESEAAARMVPIVASLGSLALLVWMVFRAYGVGTAILSGLIYSLMPMAVYFGRMVDHEAVCLLCMLAAVAAWCRVADPGVARRTRLPSVAAWMAAVGVGIWVDWSAVLFAAVFCAYVVFWCLRRRERRGQWRLVVFMLCFAGAVTVGMVAFVVYAGLDGRWSDLVAIFFSRTTAPVEHVRRWSGVSEGSAWTYLIENLTWPVLVLSVCGAAMALWGCSSRRRKPTVLPRADGVDVQHPHPSPQPKDRVLTYSSAARDGLLVILITGVLWVVIFWRQYEVHNYWLFYLGPAAAVFSAQTLVALWRCLSKVDASLAYACVGVALLLTVGLEHQGTRVYFGRTSQELALRIGDWRRVHRMTATGDRVALFHDPRRIEQRGGFRFVNLVPPQLAYYLDRAIDVETDFARVAAGRSRWAVFVLSKADAVIHGGALRPLRLRFAEVPLSREVVFDLRRRLSDLRK